ncbi:hypothetical protein BDQ17DRAFT_1429380 [Cyathus striatus]|nr:hypothetical protein BDQ17DRAFT_1429380 [Cyathus striatus]
MNLHPVAQSSPRPSQPAQCTRKNLQRLSTSADGITIATLPGGLYGSPFVLDVQLPISIIWGFKASSIARAREYPSLSNLRLLTLRLSMPFSHHLHGVSRCFAQLVSISSDTTSHPPNSYAELIQWRCLRPHRAQGIDAYSDSYDHGTPAADVQLEECRKGAAGVRRQLTRFGTPILCEPDSTSYLSDFLLLHPMPVHAITTSIAQCPP